MRALRSVLREYLATAHGGGRRFRQLRLWRDWESVVGSEVASLARPLGTRGRTLILGVEDGAALQETRFHAPQIIDDVNAYLGEVCFDKVQCELLMGRTPLDVRYTPERQPRHLRPPTKLGRVDAAPPADSPVGRCYRAYLSVFGKAAVTGNDEHEQGEHGYE
jgi:hypothetical protein